MIRTMGALAILCAAATAPSARLDVNPDGTIGDIRIPAPTPAEPRAPRVRDREAQRAGAAQRRARRKRRGY